MARIFTDWQVFCEQDQPCRMSQAVAQPATGRVILQVKVFGGDEPTLLVSFPLGILLGPGWRYRIDSGPEIVVPFEICDMNGCHAGVPLQADLLRSMQRGNRMKVTFFDAARTPVEPVVSLAGFTSAWNALD